MKRILYILFLVLLFIPLFQKWIMLIPEKPLYGAFAVTEKPELSASNWFNGFFQSAYEKHFNEKLGFHASFVRLRNTFLYDLFGETNAHVVFGKENYLYEQDYIDAHYGTDYVGLDSLRRTAEAVCQLRDTLAAHGKAFVIFLAPSKADFFPEHLPDSSKKAETDSTNYKQLSRLLKQRGIPVIDYNYYYMSCKATSPYPLYSKYGIHWSYYGSMQATDSLMHYIADARNTEMPRVVTDNFKVQNKPDHSDYDLGNLLNLSHRLKGYPLCYPQWHWQQPEDTVKMPCLLTISDSYYWEMYFYGRFWYYNTTAYPESFDKETSVSSFNLKEEIEKADVVIIMSTTPGLKTFSWGFVQNALNAYRK